MTAHRRGVASRVASLLAVAGLLATAAPAQQQSVVATVHNLSVSGPGAIRSMTETEVCKFCHIPHSAVVPTPLWGHKVSSAQYLTPSVRSDPGGFQPAPQPDGSSRLCLSCHDGTVALGDLAGESRPVAMSGAERLAPGHPSSLGTDLSGSHPISILYPSADPGQAASGRDIGLRDAALVRLDPDVRLDSQGKVQCTSCHDPHADRYFQPGRVPHFWVKPSISEVCLTCHAAR